MFRSPDGKITVDVVKTMADAVIPAADFSIFNIPEDQGEAGGLFANLYNSPIPRHISLFLCRHSRKDKLSAIGNLQGAQNLGLSFLDTVTLWYEKPTSSSNIGFLPVAEDGYLFYKGDVPNIANTSWFAGTSEKTKEDEHRNATNMWGLSPAEYEERGATYYRKFAWEIGLLLYTMAHPVQMKKFIYALDDDYEHVLKFAKHYSVAVHFIVTDQTDAKNIISRYEVT